MKKHILLIVVFLAGNLMLAHAQTEKGKWLIAGSSDLSLKFGKEKFKYGSTTNDGEKFSSFSLSPEAGYFVIDQLAAGLFIDFSASSYKYGSSYDYKNTYTTFLVGPFARYYITDLNGFWPYAQASLGFGSYNEKSDYGPGRNGAITSSDALFGYRVGVGATHFLTENVGFDLYLGYAGDTEKHDAEPVRAEEKAKRIENYLMFRLGFVVSLGK